MVKRGKTRFSEDLNQSSSSAVKVMPVYPREILGPIGPV